MTLKEYQENHYALWGYIADRILYERELLSIPDLKREWLHANYKADIANNCFICDYLLGAQDSCEECITMLGFKRNGECLGGLYRDCVLSTSYIEQYKKKLARLETYGEENRYDHTTRIHKSQKTILTACTLLSLPRLRHRAYTYS